MNKRTRLISATSSAVTLAALVGQVPASAAVQGKCLTQPQIDSAVELAVTKSATVIAAQKALTARQASLKSATTTEALALAAYKKALKTKSLTDDKSTKAKHTKAVAARVKAAAEVASALARLNTLRDQVRLGERTRLEAAQRCASATITLGATAGDRQISLDWNAATGATSYQVLRDGVVIATTTELSYIDTTAQNGVTYTYQIVSDAATTSTPLTALSANSFALAPLGGRDHDDDDDDDEYEDEDGDEGDDDEGDDDDDDNGGGTNPGSFISSNPLTATAVISTPTNLVASAVSGTVELTWAQVLNAVEYQVLRDGVVIATVSGTTYSDSWAEAATYTVRAVDGASISVDSAGVSVTGTLAAPSSLVATPGNASVSLSWQAVTGATEYQVYRDNNLVRTVSVTSYVDSGLTNGTTYNYTIKAVKGLEVSPASSSVSVVPALSVVVPNAPTGLAGVSGDSQVALSWNAVSGATSYEVWRGGAFLATTNTTSYTDLNLTNGQTYQYTVRAIKSSVSSLDSSTVSATPVAPVVQLAAPTSLTAGTATSLNTGALRLSWAAVTGATSYEVFRNGALLGTSSTTTYTPTAPAAGSASFEVRALNANPSATSAKSAAVTIGYWTGAAANDTWGRNTYGQITVSLVTVGTTVTGCWATYPTTSDSGSINRSAIPTLCNQVLSKKPTSVTASTAITLVSGASATTPAFRTSLTSALTKAGL